MNATTPVIEIHGLHHSYGCGGRKLEILRGLECSIPRGKWFCILGASGCGKTTLLNLIGGLEKPVSGSIKVDGVEISSFSRGEAARFRAGKIGFVFQSYHLLPELDILENTVLAARLAGVGVRAARRRGEELLGMMGLKERLTHRPSELSGGEQQRAAIARALINDPGVLLADEPTGNLDPRSGEEVLEVFSRLRAIRPDRSTLMITHNREIARLADGVLLLEDGVLKPLSSPDDAARA